MPSRSSSTLIKAVPWLLRPVHLRPFHWDPFIWDHVRLRPRHLRPIFSRPRSIETTFIWDLLIWGYIHLRPHSFETTIILRQVKKNCFDLRCMTFYDLLFTFFAGDLKFCKVTLHLMFWTVTPCRVQGWLMLGYKCTHNLKHRRNKKTFRT